MAGTENQQPSSVGPGAPEPTNQVGNGDRFHPDTEAILKYLTYGHLHQGQIRAVSSLICDVAWELAEILPSSPETRVALRKLLDAKDAACRSVVDDEQLQARVYAEQGYWLGTGRPGGPPQRPAPAGPYQPPAEQLNTVTGAPITPDTEAEASRQRAADWSAGREGNGNRLG